MEFFISCPSSALAPDHVWPLVDFWLDVDVSVACFCDGSDAPLHVLSVELELCFGDVVVELLDGLGIVCASLVGDVLAGEVRRALAFCLVLSYFSCIGANERRRFPLLTSIQSICTKV